MKRNMHREDIKAAIRKTGKTLNELSLEAGLSGGTVGVSLLKPIPSANAAVANFLGKSLHEIWPQWYDRHGNRIISSLSSQSIKVAADCHCQKSSKKSTERKNDG